MQHYATDAAVASLEELLTEAKGREHVDALVELAWHLRQRNVTRAARLALTRAECALLLSRVDEAEALATRAGTQFTNCADAAGCGDAQRLAHARSWALLASGFGDPAAMSADLDDIRASASPCSAPLEAHLKFIQGVAAFQRNAFLDAVPLFNAVVGEAAACGLLEQAFRAEAGLVSAHSNLGDRESSCAVAERLLARARALGWPRAIGHALANFARQLSDSGQPERAVDLLLEARAVLADQPLARGYAIATYYLGDALLALGRNEEALAHLRHAETLMRDLGSRPEVACLQAIAAQPLSRLGRVQEALDSAQAALVLSRQTTSRLWEVEALRSLAEVLSTHAPATGTTQDASLALHYLDQALGVVEAIGGHHEKSQICTEIALAHEAAGDAARAQGGSARTRPARPQPAAACPGTPRDRAGPRKDARSRVGARHARAIAQGRPGHHCPP